MSDGGLIRRARQHAGLTQDQLAARLAITGGGRAVSDAERSPNPTVGLLARYGKAMGYELAVYFITPDGDSIE